MSGNERTVQPGCFFAAAAIFAVAALVTIAGILGEIRDVLKAGCQ